jgi:pimeloyl-ACP methyl ester carboxylesterase
MCGTTCAKNTSMLTPRWLVLGIAAANLIACGPADEGVTEDAVLAKKSLEEEARVASLDEVCPSSRDDALCSALRAGETQVGWEAAQAYGAARDAIVERLAVEPREQTMSDPAVRFWIRERTVSLFVWNTVTSFGTVQGEPTEYWKAADAVLEEHLPAYDPWTLPLARLPMAPPEAEACESPRELVLFFPGVIRLGARDEFHLQAAALEAALPCVRFVRIETGSFVDPAINAKQAKAAVDAADSELGELPLHFVGYSQGSINALETLVAYPELAERAKSVLTLNAAAHGSEVADTLGQAVAMLNDSKAGCDQFADFARPLCKTVAAVSPKPTKAVLQFVAGMMGVPLENLEAFLQAEDTIAPAPTLEAFLQSHLPGIQSLTTKKAAAFWNGPAAKLPRHVVYTSFRAAISDTWANLPPSNALGFALLQLAGRDYPNNDMQVRLQFQTLGGPVADLEVVGRVFEGNHWQWELAVGDVPDNVMPRAMIEGLPREHLLVGYFQALAELGIVDG